MAVLQILEQTFELVEDNLADTDRAIDRHPAPQSRGFETLADVF